MATGPGSLSRHNHLEEFTNPLVTNEGVLTASQRQARARTALGIADPGAGPLALATYAFAELPDATAYAGHIAIITDDANSGYAVIMSDGTNWIVVETGTAVADPA